MSDNSPGGCRSPDRENDLLTTVLTTKVWHLLGFIIINTDLELCLVDHE